MEAEEDDPSSVGLLTAWSQVWPAGLWDWQEDPSSSGAVAGSRLQEYSWITQSTMVGPSHVPTFGLSPHAWDQSPRPWASCPRSLVPWSQDSPGGQAGSEPPTWAWTPPGFQSSHCPSRKILPTRFPECCMCAWGPCPISNSNFVFQESLIWDVRKQLFCRPSRNIF